MTRELDGNEFEIKMIGIVPKSSTKEPEVNIKEVKRCEHWLDKYAIKGIMNTVHIN